MCVGGGGKGGRASDLGVPPCLLPLHLMSFLPVANQCGVALATASPLLCAQELESTASLCFKAAESSTDVVRCSVAELLGRLLIASQQPLPPHQKGKGKQTGVQEALGTLAQGFTKGSGGLFKGSGGELLKTGVGGASGEVRVTVTLAYVLFLHGMGPHWVERNAAVLLHHILDLLSSSKTTATHIGAVYARNCVQFILGEAFVRLLRESMQLQVARLLCSLARQGEAQGERLAAGEAEKKGTPTGSQNELVCILVCLGRLVVKLNTAALPLVVSMGGRGEGGRGSRRLTVLSVILHPTHDMLVQGLCVVCTYVHVCVVCACMSMCVWCVHACPCVCGVCHMDASPAQVGDSASLAPDSSNAGPLMELILSALAHSSLAVRLAAAWCLRCVAGTLQTQLTSLLDLCLARLRHFRGAADAVSGYSSAVAALLASVRQSQLGLHTSKIKVSSEPLPLGVEAACGPYCEPPPILQLVLVSAEELLSSSDNSQKLSAPLSQAAWTMIGACCTTGAAHSPPPAPPASPSPPLPSPCPPLSSLPPLPSIRHPAGSALMKPHLGRVVHLWKETFPRSMKELRVEQTQVGSESLFAVIERRAGALASECTGGGACSTGGVPLLHAGCPSPPQAWGM